MSTKIMYHTLEKKMYLFTKGNQETFFLNTVVRDFMNSNNT